MAQLAGGGDVIVQAHPKSLRDVLLDIACRLTFVGLAVVVASIVLPWSFARALGRGMIRAVTGLGDQAKKKAAEASLPQPSSFQQARKA